MDESLVIFCVYLFISDRNDVSSILDELPSDDYINDEVQQDEGIWTMYLLFIVSFEYTVLVICK
jgi:hypothetical protein